MASISARSKSGWLRGTAWWLGANSGMRPVRSTQSTAAGPSSSNVGPLSVPLPSRPWQVAQEEANSAAPSGEVGAWAAAGPSPARSSWRATMPSATRTVPASAPNRLRRGTIDLLIG